MTTPTRIPKTVRAKLALVLAIAVLAAGATGGLLPRAAALPASTSQAQIATTAQTTPAPLPAGAPDPHGCPVRPGPGEPGYVHPVSQGASSVAPALAFESSPTVPPLPPIHSSPAGPHLPGSILPPSTPQPPLPLTTLPPALQPGPPPMLRGAPSPDQDPGFSCGTSEGPWSVTPVTSTPNGQP